MICRRCRTEKPRSEFGLYGNRADYFCRGCRSAVDAKHEAQAEARQRGYAGYSSTPEYKAAQRRHGAEKQGRVFVALPERVRAGIESAARRKASSAFGAWLRSIDAQYNAEHAPESKAGRVRDRYWKNREHEIRRVSQYKRASGRGIQWSATRLRREVAQGDGTVSREVIAQLKRSADICHWCGERVVASEKQIDHVIPLCAGGQHSLSNIVIACASCNGRKAKLLPRQWDERRESVL